MSADDPRLILREEALDASLELLMLAEAALWSTVDAALEAGEGEAEGFEQAERQLENVAEHGDEHRFPDRDAPPAEEAGGAESGEADQEAPPDA